MGTTVSSRQSDVEDALHIVCGDKPPDISIPNAVYLVQNESQLLDAHASGVRFLHAGDQSGLQQLMWEFPFAKIAFVGADGDASLVSLLEEWQRDAQLLIAEASDFGWRAVRNVCGNLQRVCSALDRQGSALQGRFRGVPALICGAGPSLTPQLHRLGALRDRALLFAAGSARQALNHAGIVPHFAAVLDPDPPTDRVVEGRAKQVPLFYQLRASPALLSQSTGPMLWMSGNELLQVEQWLVEEGGITYSPFDAGWNAATFGAALALHLGCDPIILIGVDLAATDAQIYTPGVRPTCSEQASLIQVGNVHTKRDWLAAARWLSALASAHPGTRFLNASLGGLSIEGIASLSLGEVATRDLGESRDLARWVQTELQQLPLFAPLIAQPLQRLWGSIDKTGALCQSALEALARTDSRSVLLAELDLEEALCFKTILDPLWNIWKHLILRQCTEPQGRSLHRMLFFQTVCRTYLMTPNDASASTAPV